MDTHKSILPEEQRLVQNQPLNNLVASRSGEAALVMVQSGEVAEMLGLVIQASRSIVVYGAV